MTWTNRTLEAAVCQRTRRVLRGVLAVAALAYALPLSATIPAAERSALIDLYTSTNGAGWTTSTGWKTPPLDVDGFAMPGTECSWFGVTCDGGETTVTIVWLNSNNLVGTMPSTLGNLTGLQQLSLNSGPLTGSIPSFAGNTALQFLSLYGNQLTGSIPSFTANPALWLLSLAYNQLTGSIPSFAANTALFELDLNNNQLSGSISSLAANASLYNVSLEYNQLTGSIPSFAASTGLAGLRLDHNQLSGAIPSFATNTVLQGIVLSNNQLSGPIPSFGVNVVLRGVSLDYNQLTGSIPSFAANTALIGLLLNDNQLDGTIPSLAANTSLRELHLSNNRLSGLIPSFASNTALQALYLNGNQLSSPFDASLGTQTSLYNAGGLDLRWNALSSTDPTLIAFLNSKQFGGDWQSMQTISVNGLSVTGVLATQATVNWTPITYTGDTGNYQVFFATVSGGPYTPFATVTADKTATSLTVTGLAPLTPYYFVVQTTTDPHANNQNTVLSGYSAEVASATTPVELLRFGGE